MRTLKIYKVFLVLAFLLCPIGQAVSDKPSEKDGGLVVHVTWGDVDNTPATNVYIEAYGLVRKEHSARAFILKSLKAGEYQTTLPPGVYDIFISEGTSVPRCRRILIPPGMTNYWTLKLEVDDVYLNR